MASLSATEARERFSDIVSRAAVSGERTAISRHGRPVAAIVPAADLALLEAIEEAMDAAAAREALDSPDTGTHSAEDVRAILDLDT